MTEVLGQAVLELTTDASKLDSELKTVGSRLTGTGAAITGLTAPILGIGTAALKMGTDFNHSLDLIVGLVGISREQVNDWKDDIYELGKETAKSPKELADALYFVTSSGVEASQAMDVLRMAAQASAAGLGETSAVADAVTSAMNAYGAENLSAAQATSVLTAMVREGKGEAAAFAPVLGHVIPIAAQLGVSFEQVGGALAFFTRFGLPAAEAATALRQILQSMVKPTRQEATELAKMGMSFGELQSSLREKGLLATLQMLQERVGGNTEALAKIFPRVDGLSGVLSILGENAGMAEQVFASLANTTEADLGAAFGAVAEGPGFKMKQAINELRVELVQLGDTLLPLVADIIVPGVGKASEAFGALVKAFQALPEPAQKVIIAATGLVGALGPVVLTIGLAVTAFASLSSAGLPVGAMMAALGAGLLSWAAPVAAVIALVAILGTDIKDLAIVLGIAAAAFVAYRAAMAAASFASVIAGVLSVTAGMGAMTMATSVATVAVGGLRAAMMTLPGALIALTVGFVALDFAVKKILGYGLIDWITGAGAAAKSEAAKLQEFGRAIDLVNLKMKEGTPEAQSYAETLEHYGQAIRDAVADSDKLYGSLVQQGIPAAISAAGAYGDLKETLEILGDEILSLGDDALMSLLPQLKALLVTYPELGQANKDLTTKIKELEATWDAQHPPMTRMHEDFTGLVRQGDILVPVTERLAAAVEETGDAAEQATVALESYLKNLEVTGSAVDNLATVVLSRLGDSLEHLELERRANELEAFGDAAPEGELEAVNAQLEAMDRHNQDVTLSLKILGQRLYDTFGPKAAEQVNALATMIADPKLFPREKVIELFTILNALSANEVLRFIDALVNLRLSIPVSFVVAKSNLPPAVMKVITADTSGLGRFLDKFVTKIGNVALATVPAGKGVDSFAGAVGGAGAAAGGSGGGGGGAAEKVLTLSDALSDSTVSLDEATKLGLDPMAAAASELGMVGQKTAEDAYRAQVELAKLSIQLGPAGITADAFNFAVMVGIARGELKDTGLALEKFMQDGVISLAEAIEGKLNPSQVAAIELTRERFQAEQKAAEAMYRANVELGKLALAMGENGVTGATLAFWAAAKLANEGTLTLKDALDLGLTPATAASIQAMADIVKKHEELKAAIFAEQIEMATFTAQLKELPGPTQSTVLQLHDLGMRLGNEGLGQAALDFQLAMQEVNSTFGSARTAASDLAYAIGTDLLGQIQSLLGSLLGGATVETAQLQLQIDTLQWQLAIQEAAGATEEQTQSIRDQIAALQKQQEVYTAEHRVMQDRATLADQTLPTERELKSMAEQLTTAIGLQSGQVKGLTTATYLQTVVTGYAKDQAQRLGDTSKGAADYVWWSATRLGDAHNAVIRADYNLAGAAGYAAGILNSLHVPEGFASGGIASGLSMVGEQGRELIWAPPGTRVFSHPETERILAGTSGGSRGTSIALQMTVNVSAADSPAEVGRRVGEVASRTFVRELRARGVVT